jgi:cellulose synthase (UDP-forming)
MAKLCYCAPATARIVFLNAPSRGAVYFAALAAGFYFPWRLTTFNPDAMILSSALYAAEVFGLVAISLHAFMTWRILEREAPPPLPDASVDVFVPTYNEPVEMLRRTIMAARNMTYPHQTWLLDDGNRPEMAAMAEELGVHYLARPNNEHAKAGNLNNALAHSKGQFIAIFDADHVPHKNFLVRALGYFSDPKVAFVQTPQDFYNLDSFQHRHKPGTNYVWTEQSLFFRVIMRGKDYWNAAFFCGSCAIVRRSALEQIGGFATETVTEDLHTSVRLHKKGFGSVYHPESLAYGLAPATFEPYETQRVRWGQGAMQVWRAERIISGRGLTWPQRICYFASVLTYFDGWQKGFMFLLPSFVLVTGMLPMASLDANFVMLFLPWYVLSLWACEELGRGYARSWTIEQYNFLRAPGFAFSTLTFFFNRRLRFRVTKKGSSSSWQNVRRILPQLSVIAIAITSLLVGVVRFSIAPHMSASALAFNIVWCLLTSYIAGVAIKFALERSVQERAAYRFHLPVPVKLRDAHGDVHLLAAQNISSGGFLARGSSDVAARPGTTLAADLILPSGPTWVAIEVKRSTLEWQDDSSWRVLAAKFAWPSKADADALDLHLYGTDAEWRFGSLRERAITPVEGVIRLIRRAKALSLDASAELRPAVVVPEDFSRSIEVLAASDDDMSVANAVLSEIPLPVGVAIALILPHDGHIARYRIATMRLNGDTGRILYFHRLSKLPTSPQPAEIDLQKPMHKPPAQKRATAA